MATFFLMLNQRSIEFFECRAIAFTHLISLMTCQIFTASRPDISGWTDRISGIFVGRQRSVSYFYKTKIMNGHREK